MKNIELGAYYFPLTTQCPVKQERASELGEHIGHQGVIDETLLVQRAASLFTGHRQPVVYTIGDGITSWDDSSEASIDRQIGLAQDSGLDFFIFDSYEGHRDGVSVAESTQPLENFKKLARNRLIQYGKMIVFASPRVVLPVSKDPDFYEPGRAYDMTVDAVRAIVDRSVSQDWGHPNYLHIDDRPYISFFLPALPPNTNVEERHPGELISEVREYSNKMYGINPYIVGAVRTAEQAEEIAQTEVDALTGYAFLPEFGDNVPPIQEYSEQLSVVMSEWERIRSRKIFIPPAVVGWDASPRGKSEHQLGSREGYGYAPIVVGNSPDAYENMLRASLRFTIEHVPENERHGIICAWNEIGEGAALLPRVLEDGTIDTSYMDATRRAIDSINAERGTM